jgi:hypothetical protein
LLLSKKHGVATPPKMATNPPAMVAQKLSISGTYTLNAMKSSKRRLDVRQRLAALEWHS